MLYRTGQTSTAADGTPKHPGVMAAQFKLAWTNRKDALSEMGMRPANVVHLNMYTIDVDALMAVGEEMPAGVAADGCNAVGTLLGAARLFDPSVMVEPEATAVA